MSSPRRRIETDVCGNFFATLMIRRREGHTNGMLALSGHEVRSSSALHLMVTANILHRMYDLLRSPTSSFLSMDILIPIQDDERLRGHPGERQ